MIECVKNFFPVVFKDGVCVLRELTRATNGMLRLVTDGTVVERYPSGVTITTEAKAGDELRHYPYEIVEDGTTATLLVGVFLSPSSDKTQ